jgi:hypothetical protein
MRIIIFIVGIFTLSITINSCQKEETNTFLTIKLKDKPNQFDEVKVEVIGVELHHEDSGWVEVSVTDSIYDLLLLQDSANAILGNITLSPGKISQIRLILDDKNSLTISGISYPLELSSEDESGLKLNVQQELQSGFTYTLLIDFDAAQSIVENGNGTYKLKPVLTAEFF